MIKGIDNAVVGLLDAQKRAGQAAENIVRNVSPKADIPERSANKVNKPITASTRDLSTPSEGGLIQDIVDLKTASIAFKASAKVFKTIDETLGTLLDKDE